MGSALIAEKPMGFPPKTLLLHSRGNVPKHHVTDSQFNQLLYDSIMENENAALILGPDLTHLFAATPYTGNKSFPLTGEQLFQKLQ